MEIDSIERIEEDRTRTIGCRLVHP